MPSRVHTATAPRPVAVSPEAAREAIAELLQPVMALALQAGLKYADLDALLREQLLAQAPRVLASENVSQISVLTGLNRKAVAQLRRGQGSLARAQSSTPASQLFTLWRHLSEKEPVWRRLPINAPLQEIPKARARSRRTAPPSFARLARQVSTDVHPRSMLDELLRLGLAQERQGEVELVETAFVPRHDRDERLALATANAAAHLATGIHNCQPEVRPWLEQALWADGISRADCERLDDKARALWASAHRALFDTFAAMPEAAAGEPRHRVRVGIYVHAEPMQERP